ncbi:MAG: helix-turn-helix transcriptional regulator [Lachnospiraceae bacterium]|nr:helix-turn-helix transcriptional regulator [Lachnospiraceae bacterium]
MKDSNKLPLSKQKEIAERLKDLRISAGYTQEDIAKKIKVTTKTYREWEVGKYTKADTFYYPAIEYDNLLCLSEIYGVSTDYLLCHSNCRSVDNHYISKKTGLSEQSINILSNRENGRDIIDAFISSTAYKEFKKYTLYFLETKFKNFQQYIKEYEGIVENAKNIDKNNYAKIEQFAKQADRLDLHLEICVNSIDSFGYQESYVFEKFLDEYKKKLAVKYEYDKFMQIFKKDIFGTNHQKAPDTN